MINKLSCYMLILTISWYGTYACAKSVHKEAHHQTTTKKTSKKAKKKDEITVTAPTYKAGGKYSQYKTQLNTLNNTNSALQTNHGLSAATVTTLQTIAEATNTLQANLFSFYSAYHASKKANEVDASSPAALTAALDANNAAGQVQQNATQIQNLVNSISTTGLSDAQAAEVNQYISSINTATQTVSTYTKTRYD